MDHSLLSPSIIRWFTSSVLTVFVAVLVLCTLIFVAGSVTPAGFPPLVGVWRVYAHPEDPFCLQYPDGWSQGAYREFSPYSPLIVFFTDEQARADRITQKRLDALQRGAFVEVSWEHVGSSIRDSSVLTPRGALANALAGDAFRVVDQTTIRTRMGTALVVDLDPISPAGALPGPSFARTVAYLRSGKAFVSLTGFFADAATRQAQRSNVHQIIRSLEAFCR